MPRFITVPVLTNQDRTIQNSPVSINVTSKYVATVQKASAAHPPSTKGNLIPVLQVQDPELGTLYLNMTYAAYQAAIIAATSTYG